jgi:iron complex outermembrane receptor protein
MISAMRSAGLLRTTSVATLLLVLTSAANAEATPPGNAPADAQPTGPVTVTNDIVVTAQKREQRLKDVPASVLVLGGNELRNQSADTLQDYVARVPGLTMRESGPGQQQLVIRGVSTGAGFASTVATYIDDAPVGASNGDGVGGQILPEIDSIDLARIEVLRGPQGTLYGASNIGGLVKYVTVAPNLEHIDGAASVEGVTAAHGDTGYAVRGRISVPLVTDQLALQVSGYARQDPGFIDDAGQGRNNLDQVNTKGAHVTLVAEPIDHLKITLSALGQNKSSDGYTVVDADPITLAPLYGPYQQRRTLGTEHVRTNVRLYSGTVAYDLGWAQISSTTSYNTIHYLGGQDETAFFTPFFPKSFGLSNLGYSAAFGIDQDKLSEEVRLAGSTGGGKFDWTTGVYYTHETSNTQVGYGTVSTLTGQPVSIGTPLLNALTIGSYHEIAGFAQATYHFSPAFKLDAGVRYAHNWENDIASSSGLLGGGPVTNVSARGSAATFSVAPEYQLSQEVSVYARVATGYRPGGANGITAPSPTYGSDRVINYEGGFKGSMMGGRLSFDIDGFYIDWTKIQLQVQNQTTGITYTANAGKASSRGVEGSLSYAFSRAFSIGGSATYIVAHLDRGLPAGQYGVAGAPLPFAPKWKIAATADYKTELSPGIGFFAGGSVFYVSQVSGNFRATAAALRAVLPGYATVDGRIGLTRDKWTLALVAKNIFDKRGYDGVTNLTSANVGPIGLNIIQPRSLSISLRYNY